MKLYIVYYRTMIDSPDVNIVCATTDLDLANENFLLAKKWEEEFMADEDEDSGNWAEACMESFDMSEDREPGEHVYVYVETKWLEGVETSIHPFLYEENAKSMRRVRKEVCREDYPELVTLDDDESFDEATHLQDDSVMVDFYFDVDAVALQ